MWMPSMQTEESHLQPYYQRADSADMPGHIMIVDDSREVAGALAALLQLSGHTVELFNDGRRALAAVAIHPPDLVILDGGKGQLSAGLAALADAGRLQIPIAALAKEREELFVPNRPEPIVLPRTAQGLYLVQRIRDEAHRFAVSYHQNVRAKRAVRSVLDDIAGVGPARKRALLRKFGSVRAMQEAPVEELAAVGRVGPALAGRIKQALMS